MDHFDSLAEHPTVRRYAWVMKWLGLLYLVVGMLFFLLPDQIFQIVNFMSDFLGFQESMPLQVERFWLVLAVSMMLMLSALSFLSSKAPLTRGYAWVHILSKTASSAGFLIMFFVHKNYFGYLAGIITDLPLALLVGGLYFQMAKQVPTRL